MQWDIFCKVIDNYGDIGVCWRLCADLAARGHHIRLWVDDSSALTWMAPGAREGQWPGIQIHDWEKARAPEMLRTCAPSQVWVEGFGCEIASEFIANYVESTSTEIGKDSKNPVWINLEYLSAEDYVERCHGLPSPVMHGPARGWTKHFFYPGFTPHTGGLLREADYLARQAAFGPKERNAWLARQGVTWQGERLISLFCYEPPALASLLRNLAEAPVPTGLLVTPGRAQQALETAWSALGWPHGELGMHQNLRCHTLDQLPQRDFDALLWSCDLNFVRGEDSLARAMWAGKPWIWNIYPQDDGAHADKLHALLERMQAPVSLRAAHVAWNGLASGTDAASRDFDWQQLPLTSWGTCAQHWCRSLLQMEDLSSQLLKFVQKNR